MINRIIWILLLVLGWWLLRGLLRGPRRRSPRSEDGRSRSPRGELRPEDPMVRDRVCNTFLPKSRALVVRDEHGEHFFCSEACRSRFASETRAS